MSQAGITTPWKGTGTQSDPRRPQLYDDHPLPVGAVATDVTGQAAANLPPTPNLLTVQVSNYTGAWLTAVQADATYSVLWSN